MVCNYYIQHDIVIEYIDDLGRISVIYTNKDIIKGSVYICDDLDSDDDQEIINQKYKAELTKIIEKNTRNKTLFENNMWIKEVYRKKYEKIINNVCKEIKNITKVYKKVTATEIS